MLLDPGRYHKSAVRIQPTARAVGWASLEEDQAPKGRKRRTVRRPGQPSHRRHQLIPRRPRFHNPPACSPERSKKPLVPRLVTRTLVFILLIFLLVILFIFHSPQVPGSFAAIYHTLSSPVRPNKNPRTPFVLLPLHGPYVHICIPNNILFAHYSPFYGRERTHSPL